MPRYKILEKSYFNDRIYEEGEEVEFDHAPGFNLEPIDAAAKKRKAEMDEKGKSYSPKDPNFISDMIAKNNETNAV